MLLVNYTVALQDLYEIAFAYYSEDKPFSLYTLRPRQKLPLNETLGNVNLEPRTVLVLEEDDKAADPLVYLCNTSKVCVIILDWKG